MSVDKIPFQPTLYITESSNLTGEKAKTEVDEIKQDITPNIDEIEKVVQSLNNFIQSSNTHIKFELHEKLNEYYVTVVDNQTNEVVREIPSKKILDVYSAMTEFIGLMFDKKI